MVSLEEGKWKTRKGAVDKGRPYEQQLPALFAIKCIFDDSIEDMWMAINVEGFGSSDDLVLFVNRNGRKTVYLFQFTHKEKSVHLNKTDKHFQLEEYEKNFKHIKNCFLDGSSPLNSYCEFEDIRFILFFNTGMYTKYRDFTVDDCDDREKFLNTGKVFKISNTQASNYDEQFLKQFYIYCNQINVENIGTKIRIEVGKHFKNCDICDIVVKFFTDWISQSFKNGEIRLTQNDIKSVLLETVLMHYIPVPKMADVFQKANVWNEVTEECNFVVVNNKIHLPKIWHAVQMKVNQNICSENIGLQNWNEPLERASDKIKGIEQWLPKNFPIKKNKQLYRVKDFFMILWHISRVSIVLNLDMDSFSHDNIRNAITKLELPESQRRYVFVGSSNFSFPNESVFYNLMSISEDKRRMFLQNTYISLQGRESVLLERLNPNKNALEKITPDTLLQLLENKHIQRDINFEENYITRWIKKPTVSIDIFRSVNAVFIVAGQIRTIEVNIKFPCILLHKYIALTSPNNRQKFMEAFKITPKQISVIVVREISPKLFNEIENKIKRIREAEDVTIHYFRYNEGNTLEWLHSNKNISEIKPFVLSDTDEEVTKDEELFDNLSFNILSNISGEGKSTLLEYIEHTCPPDTCVIRINIKEISNYTRIKNADADTVMKTLYQQSISDSKLYELFSELFQCLLDNLKVLIIVDGLDGINFDENTRLFLENFKSRGVKTLLATRPFLQNTLENNFNTLSLSLAPLTMDDQQKLVKCVFSNCTDQRINEVTQKISSWSHQFVGIPLQIKLFANILEEQFQINFDTFDITDLFDTYVKVQLKKVGSCNNATLRTLSRLSLLQFYKAEVVNRLFNLDELVDDIEDKRKIFTDSKLIQAFHEDFNVTFVHQSLPEFLLARHLDYLTTKLQYDILRPLVNCLFYKEFEMVRIFFDKIALKNSPLHKAVLEDNEYGLVNLLQEFNYDTVDKYGRNVLHIAASYGKRNELRTMDKLAIDVNVIESDNDIPDFIIPCDEYDNKLEISTNMFCKLLQFGLDPYKKDHLFGMDVFDFATRSNSLEIVEELFTSGFVKELDTNKDILLYQSVKNAYWNIFKHIKNKNFNLKVGHNLDSLLHIALFSENIGIVEEIANNINDIDERNLLDETPLIKWLTAVCEHTFSATLNENQLNIINLLVEKKANANARNLIGKTPLHCICISENVSLIQKLIANGARLNEATNFGDTPLHFAASGSLDNVKLLVEKKSEVDVVNNDGHAPLHNAAMRNQVEIVEFFLQIGADVNKIVNGNTALKIAAFMGHLECVKILIKSGAKINNEAEVMFNPITDAVLGGHLDCVQLLVSEGASILGQSFFIATWYGYEQIVDFLLAQGFDIDAHVWEYEYTSLHHAVNDDSIECVKLLLSKGCNINARNIDGETPLHMAAESGFTDIIRYMVEQGADMNTENKRKLTPLDILAQKGNLDCVKFFIAKLNNVQKYGARAVYFAARQGHVDVIHYLASVGADVNQKILDDTFPIFGAVEESQLECLKVLLAKGCSINAKKKGGVTPLHMASTFGFTDIVQYLAQQGAEINVEDDLGLTPLDAATQVNRLDCVKLLIAKGSNVERYGSRAVCFAAYQGHIDVMSYIISMGVDVNQKVCNVTFSIFGAVYSSKLECVKVLLTNGCNINERNSEGCTPLHVASRCGFTDIVQCLVVHGAEISIKNEQELTPYDVAIQEGHLDCAKFLTAEDVDTSRKSSS